MAPPYAATAALVAAALALPAAAAAPAQQVERVLDGDTIVLAGGTRIRLLQIDAPEPGAGECYSRAAGRALRRLLPAGRHVRLESDPPLDLIDRYGRALRYVHRESLNVNLELVRRGHATVYLYRRQRGKYAAELLAAARAARAKRLGLWGACDTVWNPYQPATTRHR